MHQKQTVRPINSKRGRLVTFKRYAPQNPEEVLFIIVQWLHPHQLKDKLIDAVESPSSPGQARRQSSEERKIIIIIKR